ncbi:MAG: cupin domain-containing protein [Alistipes sp.]|nr:cupin domain-containing protein [Alistipes sp.]MBQ5921974.1 cupin domain-containing protein [Alistipes sp.]
MKQIEKIAAGAGYTCISVGKMAELSEHVLELGPEVKIPGKVFAGAAAGTTGAELSFQSFPVGGQTGFLHTHRTHEELYFFLSGEGQMQVDGDIIPVAEGSVVRVAPAPKRSVRNTGDEPLVMLCIQYKEASFTAEDATDGEILAEPVVW